MTGVNALAVLVILLGAAYIFARDHAHDRERKDFIARLFVMKGLSPTVADPENFGPLAQAKVHNELNKSRPPGDPMDELEPPSYDEEGRDAQEQLLRSWKREEKELAAEEQERVASLNDALTRGRAEMERRREVARQAQEAGRKREPQAEPAAAPDELTEHVDRDGATAGR